MPPRIIAENLVKIYRGGLKAVDNVSFEAGDEVLVIMGPNGSGKTTTLSMIAGALKPTSGRVLVDGLDLWGRDWAEARGKIGFAPQNMPFRDRLTLVENLTWYGMIRGLSFRESKRRAKNLLETMGLGGHADKPVRALSGGQRRRLTIAAALMGDPEILILDEPTSGLDPSARKTIWDMLHEQARGKTVIVSTHIAEDAEENADRVIIFHRGRIVAEGEPEALIKRYAPNATIVVEGRLNGKPEIDGATLIRFSESQARYMAGDPDTVLPRLIEAFIKMGSKIESVQVRKPGLYEVFLNLTGVRLDEEVNK